MKKVAVIIGLFLIGGLLKTQAQQTYRYLMFNENPYLINPGYAGWGEDVQAFGHYRNEMAGFRGGPQTSLLTFDAPINSLKFGLGVTLFNDQVNVIQRQGANLTYAYKLQLPNEQRLSFGLSLGFATNSINQDQIVAENPGEVSQLSLLRPSTSFNADFGAVYAVKGFELAIGASNLFNRNNFDDPNLMQFEQNPTFTIMPSYEFEIAESWVARPALVARSSQGLPFQLDVLGVVEWNKMLWGGFAYSTQSNLGLIAGINYEGLKFGYSYQYPIGDLNIGSFGSHELMLGINFSVLSKKPKIKSMPTTSQKPVSKAISRRDTTVHIVVYDANEEVKKLQQIYERDAKVIDNAIMKFKYVPSNSSTSPNAEAEVATAKTEGEEVYPVLGSFVNFEEAKKYQKLMQRELGTETSLLRSADKKFYLVTPGKVENYEKGVEERERFKQMGSDKYTNGEIWFYKAQ